MRWNSLCRGIWIAFAAAALASAANVCAAAQASNDEERFARYLKRYPESDADGNGVLTNAEARAFRNRRNADGDERTVERGASRSNQNAQPNRNRKPAPDHQDVSYGPHERNVMDVWLAKTRGGPAPIAVYIHGGGFKGGDKGSVSAQVIEQCLASGIHVASINYRYSTIEPYPGPMMDSARAIQFIRHNAKEWNIDPGRVAAYGGSAGAGISLWLAFHNDLADPQSDDPVARQSTRLSCAASINGQSSYDPNVIQKWVGGRAHEHEALFLLFDVKNVEDYRKPELKAMLDDSSPITHLTPDDPPIYMHYKEADEPLPADAKPGQGIHHPVFGHRLKAAMDELGIESIYRHQDEDQGNYTDEMVAFFRKHFGMDTE